MPMRSIVGDFPWETSLNHCIVVGSPHIGAGQGAPGGVGTQVHSDVPFLRTVTISQSRTVAESAMYSGAARSASAIFSSVVGSLLSVMVTELQYSDAIIHKSLHLPVSSPFRRKLTFQPFTNFAPRSFYVVASQRGRAHTASRRGVMPRLSTVGWAASAACRSWSTPPRRRADIRCPPTDPRRCADARTAFRRT